MKNEMVRDVNGNFVGRKVEFSNGREELRDMKGRLIGAYDPNRKATIGPRGNQMTSGNILSSMISSLLGK